MPGAPGLVVYLCGIMPGRSTRVGVLVKSVVIALVMAVVGHFSVRLCLRRVPIVA